MRRWLAVSGLPSSIQNPPRKRPLPPFVLWVGVLLADWCIMAPVLLIGAMMSSGWVGGSSHPENFWHIVIPSLGVLAILSALALFAWRHVRWFYWVALVLLAIVSWSNVAGLYKGLLHPTEECGIGFVLAVTGLFLCPLSAVLLAARKARAYYAALVAYRRQIGADAAR